MSNEFVKQMQVVSVTPGTLQFNGIQLATIAMQAVDGTCSMTFTTNMADPLSQYVAGTALWVRFDDTQPTMTIPSIGAPASESTASVITATVENIGAPQAQ
ncbi:hypothetical protein [Burkholderia ubonensis]|uniref:hypothetical protein n=1 Tax=Burkholderia ubonensis TaxID=101571 RepID=UPI0007562064|nr:hypothetical protein [Burkholderia ubonensis]AOI70844.1 hypothetical protein WI31_15600 [Burkholderia ubonensis]KUZ07389.1 hypothetical protein WI29_34055 [Burkholderia ubonensis]KUZ20630.1 hypothetical protein WI30_01245 [Burkholderia ubonensis]KUZ33376.1 hypothetical protein WI32_19805 [Burkholderia ubonensis]KUZ44795.1 hypothetical protein WI33_28030 [Burkholderia ubonensis]